MTLSTLIPAVQLSIRAAVAAGLSVAIAQLLRLQFPLYALTAVTSFQVKRAESIFLPTSNPLGSSMGEENL